MNLKITDLRLQLHLWGANELMADGTKPLHEPKLSYHLQDLQDHSWMLPQCQCSLMNQSVNLKDAFENDISMIVTVFPWANDFDPVCLIIMNCSCVYILCDSLWTAHMFTFYGIHYELYMCLHLCDSLWTVHVFTFMWFIMNCTCVYILCDSLWNVDVFTFYVVHYALYMCLHFMWFIMNCTCVYILCDSLWTVHVFTFYVIHCELHMCLHFMWFVYDESDTGCWRVTREIQRLCVITVFIG